MPNYYEPDLTGIDPAYNKINDRRYIIKENQVIKFDNPVFMNSKLIINIIGGTNDLLIENIDYIFDDRVKDYDMVSRMKTIDNQFDQMIVSGVILIRDFIDEYEISMEYNMVFPDEVTYAFIRYQSSKEISPDDVPGLVKGLVDKMNYLSLISAGKINKFTFDSEYSYILEEDPDDEKLENMIEDEIQTVNTTQGINLIKPKYGAFFKNSVVVKNAVSNAIIPMENNYDIIEVDYVKTELTSNTSGVYHYIRFFNNFDGDVKVSYHAFGGEITPDNLEEMNQKLIQMQAFLNNTIFLTSDILGSDATVINLKNRLTYLEENMRILLNGGIPTYGDVSNGLTLKRRITSIDDAFHWWSIAELYKVDGSDEVIYADSFSFRLQTAISNMQIEGKVSFNLMNGDNPFEITGDISNIPKNTFDTYLPHLRVIYKNIGQSYSGVILQLGMKLPLSITNETIAVEDLSGKESCWKLIDFETGNPTNPQDDIISLPDGESVYNSGQSYMSDYKSIIPIPYNLLTTDNNAISISSTSNPDSILNVSNELKNTNYKDIKSISIDIVINSHTYTINIPVTIGNTILGSSVFKIDNDSYTIDIEHDIINDILKIDIISLNAISSVPLMNYIIYF